MKAEDRRNRILSMLREGAGPLSASAIAAEFGVSRQIIVGDIALLRAAGENVISTARGYMLEGAKPAGVCRSIVCRHCPADTEKELLLFIDNGCTVLDVTVEHPLYGTLTGGLNLSSRYDVGQFLKRSAELGAKSLCILTDDIHTHTVLFPDEQAVDRVLSALEEAGFLYEM